MTRIIIGKKNQQQWLRRNAKKTALQNNIKNYKLMAHGAYQYSIQNQADMKCIMLPKIMFSDR
jgi:hypothetical protein